MKYVFFGTPEFAAIILQKLIDGGFIPTVVVCNPDRPVGRKKIIAPPPVKTSIMGQESRVKDKIKILQPEQLDKEFYDSLFNIHPDFFIVAAYAKILPKSILDIPWLGVIGVHPSLLPKYRGASPIQSVLLNGDEETGVTLYLLDDKMDHGPTLATQKAKIENKNYIGLMRELAQIAGNLLVKILPEFIAGRIQPQPQDNTEATYTKKFSTDDAFVDEKTLEEALNGEHSEAARRTERKIRALTPEPGVWTIKNGKRTKLLEAELRDNRLVLKVIQIEGQKPVKR